MLKHPRTQSETALDGRETTKATIFHQLQIFLAATPANIVEHHNVDIRNIDIATQTTKKTHRLKNMQLFDVANQTSSPEWL